MPDTLTLPAVVVTVTPFGGSSTQASITSAPASFYTTTATSGDLDGHVDFGVASTTVESNLGLFPSATGLEVASVEIVDQIWDGTRTEFKFMVKYTFLNGNSQTIPVHVGYDAKLYALVLADAGTHMQEWWFKSSDGGKSWDYASNPIATTLINDRES